MVRPLPILREDGVSAFWQAVVSTTVIDLIELAMIIIVAAKFWNERTEIRLVSFAAGVLLSTVFLDLLPEAAKDVTEPKQLFAAILLGMIGLFFVERLLQRDHSHTSHAEAHAGHQHSPASRYFIIIGDGLHSMIDGFAIAASFILDPAVGLVTTLAVLAHEVPHQIGDYSILRRRGLSQWRALIVNFTSALTALAGVAVTFIFQAGVEDHLNLLIGFTAGMLLYIAAVNLLPEMLHGQARGRALYVTPFVAGLLLITVLVQFLPG